MSYARRLDSGAYIWSDGDYLFFDDVKLSEDKINIFLAKLSDNRPDELNDRIKRGRKLIDSKNRGE